MEEFLTASFFERPAVECARSLIGAEFFWHGCSGRIVEVEAYLEHGDPACHTFSRPSARAFVAAHAPGTAYVYLNYGVHWLFNVLTKGPEGAGFVLFRALQPLSGLARMKERRGSSKDRDLCSGPGKLTQALGIQGRTHGKFFLGCGLTGIRPATGPTAVVTGPRIGISQARENLWRFAEAGSPFMSKPLI